MVLCSITKRRGVWHGWKTLLCSKKILRSSMMDPEVSAVATKKYLIRKFREGCLLLEHAFIISGKQASKFNSDLRSIRHHL